MKKSETRNPVYLDNELITARYQYTALEIDIICRVIKAVNQQKNATIEFKVEAFIDDAATNSNNTYNQIYKALKKLLSNPMEIWDTRAHTWTAANIISGARVNKKTGKIEINIDPFLLPYLSGLTQKYTVLEMGSILAMRSVYAKRIYLMACQYRTTGIFAINVDQLRERLCIVDKYQVYQDFKKRVLNPALIEINKYAEFTIDLQAVEKAGQAVDRLSFAIKKKEAFAAIVDDAKQIKFLINNGLANWQIENCYMTKTPAEMAPILYAIYLRLQDKNKAHINNRGAYITKTLSGHGINMSKALPMQLKIE
jgi:plasmid replication initiation protein